VARPRGPGHTLEELQVIISIDLTNDAFVTDTGPGIVKILHTIAGALVSQSRHTITSRPRLMLRDANDNHCGVVVFDKTYNRRQRPSGDSN
jgi:hypothetical protein